MKTVLQMNHRIKRGHQSMTRKTKTLCAKFVVTLVRATSTMESNLVRIVEHSSENHWVLTTAATFADVKTTAMLMAKLMGQ